MWTRAELKTNAKAVLRHSYWEGVITSLVIAGITIGVGMVSGFLPFGGIAGTIFIMLPLHVGIKSFYMQNQVAPPEVNNIFFAFKGGRYMKVTGAMAWMYLFSVLWSLISFLGFFIILIKGFSSLIPFLMEHSAYTDWPDAGSSWIYGSPMYDTGWLNDYIRTIDSSWIPTLAVSGVIYIAGSILAFIKQLSYSLTPYILTDTPQIGYDRALKLSMAMTDGHKWRIFVLYLSFIGWSLLALLTFGIGFLFLAPYMSATRAELYVRLRDLAINGGLTTPEEMGVLPR